MRSVGRKPSRLLASVGWLNWISCLFCREKEERLPRMKVSLFAVCFMGAAFIMLSERSHAAPFAAGLHVQGVQAGRPGGSVGGGPRPFMARGMRQGSAFRHDDRFFFHRHQRFFPASNVIVFGYPGWYPNYYDSYPDYNDFYPDDYSGNDNESYELGYDYQYWRDLALREQAELARRAKYSAAISPISAGRPQPTAPGNLGTLYNASAAEAQDKSA